MIILRQIPLGFAHPAGPIENLSLEIRDAWDLKAKNLENQSQGMNSGDERHEKLREMRISPENYRKLWKNASKMCQNASIGFRTWQNKPKIAKKGPWGPPKWRKWCQERVKEAPRKPLNGPRDPQGIPKMTPKKPPRHQNWAQRLQMPLKKWKILKNHEKPRKTRGFISPRRLREIRVPPFIKLEF